MKAEEETKLYNIIPPNKLRLGYELLPVTAVQMHSFFFLFLHSCKTSQQQPTAASAFKP